MISNDLQTPPKCTADVCLVPMGTPSPSVSKEIAEVQRHFRKSGLKFSMHSAGTTLGTLLLIDAVQEAKGHCRGLLGRGDEGYWPSSFGASCERCGQDTERHSDRNSHGQITIHGGQGRGSS